MTATVEFLFKKRAEGTTVCPVVCVKINFLANIEYSYTINTVNIEVILFYNVVMLPSPVL